MDDYHDFLATKHVAATATGFDVADDDLNDSLFPWQRAVVKWALKRGVAALFEECGLGKTLQQLAWADAIVGREGRPVLILTPLAVAPQTAREAEKFKIISRVGVVEGQIECKDYDICITNYHKLHHFNPSAFVGVVLDESSILKSFTGKIKQALCAAFAATPYRLCCTATPSPNDITELGNHAEFLGVMPWKEMLARWFINDLGDVGTYRLKGHATADFWRWVASWAVCVSKPSDLGYPDDGYDLPPLNVIQHVVTSVTDQPGDGELFASAKLTASNLYRELRSSRAERVAKAAELVAAADPQAAWVLWCNTNDESASLAKAVPGAVEVKGTDPDHIKEARIEGFQTGRYRVLDSKPSLCGFGLNWQHCCNVAFVGLSWSFEQFHQAIRRTWRFGQKSPVNCHIITADGEGDVVATVQKKQQEHERMKEEMVNATRTTALGDDGGKIIHSAGDTETVTGSGWTMHHGDCCDVAKTVAADSIGFSVFSPPFASLYVYSEAEADMGNCADENEFFGHFSFLVPELFRVLKPGRLCAVHCKDLPRFKWQDGHAGLKDFSGLTVKVFEEAGFVYQSRVTIWKDPVREMQRTKAHHLLYKSLLKDSCGSHPCMPDYLLLFRKPGAKEQLDPVGHTRDDFSLDQWQQWASPVWMDIDQGDTLNVRIAREDKDEKHLCPLQLETIRRSLRLWSNPGDLVLSPFAGIGSEGHGSILEGRRFVGIELKKSYFDTACRNLAAAEYESRQTNLFDAAEPAAEIQKAA